jgi:serine/threonine-protein kinase
MGLTSGTRLGSYEVRSLIGAGGMGEVYEAHDSKLGRDVAIKVLPEQFARDPERLARFQREAKLLASLNHPNIATIHGLEQSGDTHYLVMELVPGETLAQRIKRDGSVPVEEALTIAKQITEALEAAHEKPIIHRDLKPANVKVTPEGRVKVLDFGLAKAFSNDTASDDPSNSPTLSVLPTQQGIIMGTAAYMSPEQARGKAVTKATDIFAFGAVLYELLTGKQAFQGEDIGDILATVVKTEPEWSRLPEATPLAIRTLLRRCLKKERRQRLGDAGAVRIEIEDVLAGGAATEPTAARASIRRLAFPGWAIAAVALVSGAMLALGVAIGAWLRRPAAVQEQARVARLAMSVPPGTELGEFAMLAISADGTQLAYTATRAGIQQIYVRPLDSAESKPLPGTEGGTYPFFSPDGQWLGFLAGGKLKKISASGGVSITLADAGAQSASWGPENTIVFRDPAGRGLMEISAAGGTPRHIPAPDPEDQQLTTQFPEFLPSGKAVLFTSSAAGTATADEKSIGILTLETGERKILIQGGSYGRYLSTGHLVFLRSGTLLAAPFDLDRLELTGPPVPVIEGVRESVTGVGAFSCSRSGTCAYAAGGMVGARRVVALVDRSGAAQSLPLPPRSYSHPRFSPAGDKMSFWIEQAACDVMVYDLARNALARVTDNGDNHFPIWSPDGKRITYISSKRPNPGYEIYWKPADGSGTEEMLTAERLSLVAISPIAWAPIGQVLAFTHRGDILLLPLDGDRKPRAFLQSRFNESMPAFSPDGRWLAYVSDESGRAEVYVQPFPGPGGKYPISTAGGTEPVWARSGGELFFRNGDQMLAVTINAQPGFSASPPKILFAGPFSRTTGRVTYDVSPDGQRFVMFQSGDEEQTSSQINVVMNWFEELKRRVPAGRNQ